MQIDAEGKRQLIVLRRCFAAWIATRIVTSLTTNKDQTTVETMREVDDFLAGSRD